MSGSDKTALIAALAQQRGRAVRRARSAGPNRRGYRCQGRGGRGNAAPGRARRSWSGAGCPRPPPPASPRRPARSAPGTTLRGARRQACSGAWTLTARVRAAGSTPTQVSPMARPGRLPSLPRAEHMHGDIGAGPPGGLHRHVHVGAAGGNGQGAQAEHAVGQHQQRRLAGERRGDMDASPTARPARCAGRRRHPTRSGTSGTVGRRPAGAEPVGGHRHAARLRHLDPVTAEIQLLGEMQRGARRGCRRGCVSSGSSRQTVS